MLRVEFHCHTSASPDSLMSPEKLLDACRRRGIDRVVITDHNTIEGALAAKAIDPQMVITGEEIMTTSGELLAAFVSAEVPAGLRPQEAIARLRAQGAFISVPHPFDRMRKGYWEVDDLQSILPQIDAIESFNARSMWPGSNHLAREFAREHKLPVTVGSDAHTPLEIGKATLLLPAFHDAASLRQALPAAQYTVSQSPHWIHFTSRWAVWVKKMRRFGS